MADITKMIEEIKNMTVMELSELVKAIEEEFGVSAAAAVVAAGPADGGAAAADEKSEYEVILTSAGEAKMNVIKAVKDILGLGLKESKELVDAAPKSVKAGISKEEADEIVKKLQDAGASVELK
ncbi:MAG: 50S ribosomal protein L7/L12 [Oscillospiraceae bacterium]|nr:50S ribosomal protein L7/L12 [Oscillospiraceae bacterium]